MNPKGNPDTLKMFSSDYQPERNGRKPSKLKGIIKEYDIGKADIAALFIMLAGENTKKELEALQDNEEYPMVVRTFAKAILDEQKKGTTKTLNEMLEFTFGRPTQPVDMSGHLTMIADRAKRRERIAELERQREERKKQEAEPPKTE